MSKKIKLLSFSIFFVLSLIGVSFLTYDRAFADEDCDPNTSTGTYPDCVCMNGAGNYPDCNDYIVCEDETACNYSAPEACEYSGPKCSCPEGTTGIHPDCSCINGAINSECDECGSGRAFDPAEPNYCIDYCDNTLACNHGAYEACEYSGPKCDQTCTPPEAGTYPACSSCTDGYERCDGTCFPNCPTGESRSLATSCLCEPGDTPCCNDLAAVNYDDQCPGDNTYEDNSGTCEYCPESDSPFCKEYFCDHADPNTVGATNRITQNQCETQNPDKNCIPSTSSCVFPTEYFCGDFATPANNPETKADCDARVNNQNINCINDPGVCEYPDNEFCDEAVYPRADNHENQFECEVRTNHTGDCVANEDVCEYSYCTIGFSLDITCPGGFTLEPDPVYFYSYQFSSFDPYNEVCTVPSQEEIEYLEEYFNQKICGEVEAPVCTGDYCSVIDWCPYIDGIQDDPTECGASGSGDICFNFPGTQSSVPAGYYISSGNWCSVCPDGVCPVINGECGSLNGGSVSEASLITGTDACLAGTVSEVGYDNAYFNWSCLGIEGGENESCSAIIDCGALGYCEYTDACNVEGVACNPPNDCVNLNVCVFKGVVSLDSKLDVTPPIVERDGVCEINVDSISGVFESFDVTTHCILSSQDSVIATFDPLYLGNTDPDFGPTTPTTFSQSVVKKDMVYSLKCYDGPTLPTNEEDYAISVGSCRLNVTTKEFN